MFFVSFVMAVCSCSESVGLLRARKCVLFCFFYDLPSASLFVLCLTFLWYCLIVCDLAQPTTWTAFDTINGYACLTTISVCCFPFPETPAGLYHIHSASSLHFLLMDFFCSQFVFPRNWKSKMYLHLYARDAGSQSQLGTLTGSVYRMMSC